MFREQKTHFLLVFIPLAIAMFGMPNASINFSFTIYGGSGS